MLTGKKVLVLGLARSGKAAIRLLQHLNADITLNESKVLEQIEGYQDYLNQGIEIVAGGQPAELFERNFDFVVKNPGINYHAPFILRLKERGIPVYTEIELGYRFAKKQNYIAITGTNGKTTTVTMVYEVLKNAHHKVHLAGNVGIPYCEVIMENNLLEEEGHDIVIEMSNFQLIDIDTFHPFVSSVINLTPDHLDYMDSLDEYYASKMRIYMNQNHNDCFINNVDDEVLQSYIDLYPLHCESVSISLEKSADCEIIENAIYYKGQHVIDINEIKVVGKHNIQNMMIAIVSAIKLGIPIESIHETLASFKGVEHRIEFVRTLHGVKYYNDSKATNTDAAIIALKAFDQPVILLMGGKEKNLDLQEMSTYNSHISTLVCFGAAGERFARDMHHPNTCLVKGLNEAISKAYEIAKDGDVVLLSPSTSSFDEFKSFEQRGRVFKEVVNQLD